MKKKIQRTIAGYLFFILAAAQSALLPSSQASNSRGGCRMGLENDTRGESKFDDSYALSV